MAQSSPGSTDQDMPQGNADSPHSASLVRGLRSRVSAAPAGEVSSPAALGPPPSPIISHGRDDLFQGLGWYIVA